MSRSSVSSSDLEQHTVIVVGRSPQHLDVGGGLTVDRQCGHHPDPGLGHSGSCRGELSQFMVTGNLKSATMDT